MLSKKPSHSQKWCSDCTLQFDLIQYPWAHLVMREPIDIYWGIVIKLLIAIPVNKHCLSILLYKNVPEIGITSNQYQKTQYCTSRPAWQYVCTGQLTNRAGDRKETVPNEVKGPDQTGFIIQPPYRPCGAADGPVPAEPWESSQCNPNRRDIS